MARAGNLTAAQLMKTAEDPEERNDGVLCPGPCPCVPGTVTMSNQTCAHATTHNCTSLADSNSDLCTACAIATSRGEPCP